MIGIIGALDAEAEYIISEMDEVHTETVSAITYTTGKIGQTDIVCAMSGVGKVFAAVCAQTMILKFGVNAIINTGIAGTLTDKLSVLDMIVADSLVQHDMDTTFFGDAPGLVSGINIVNFPCDSILSEKAVQCICESGINVICGTIASGDCFVADSAKKDYIKSTFNASACEMEGAAIGHVCFINNIPCAVIRTISDGANDELSEISYFEFRNRAAKQSAETVIELIKKI